METAPFAPLLERIRNGDPHALTEVLQDSGSYCVRVLMSKTDCPPDEADDILIEAVLIFRDKVLKGELTELSSLNAYLYRTCWNMYQERRRRQERLRTHAEEIRHTFYEESQHSVAPWEWEETKREEETHFERKLNATKQALSLLDEKCRKILNLYYFQRQRMIAIAEQLGFASADVAKTSKSRCYKKWLQEIHQQMENSHG